MDPNPIPFTYELAGCVSGAPTAVLLEGTLAPNEIHFETRAVVLGEPLVGGRTLLALALADPLILLALDPELFRADAAPETFRVEARLEGEGQRLVGRLVVVGLWAVEDGRVAIRGQITDACLGLEPGESVASWAEDSGMCVLPGDRGRVMTARNWFVETSRGGKLLGNLDPDGVRGSVAWRRTGPRAPARLEPRRRRCGSRPLSRTPWPLPDPGPRTHGAGTIRLARPLLCSRLPATYGQLAPPGRASPGGGRDP